MSREVWPGQPFPLGSTWDGSGTNFSLFSENAERVHLCLFDEDGVEERIEILERTAHNWHCYVPGVGPGQRYGYRVHGPYAPAEGHRFNPVKLLIDPYAKAVEGKVRWELANVLPYTPDDTDDADLEPDDEDDAEAIPKSVVVDQAFDWEGDIRPRTPWNETLIYETHVRGYTKRHPAVRDDLKGTYAGLASDEALAYLQRLGITAVELLPIHHIADESFLHDRGLTNYWGYSSIGYLAPHSEYAATGRRGEQLREFKGMVKALHRAGIEVILDVVYNHTAEGNHLGPMLSFKGVDNASYYRLMPDVADFASRITGSSDLYESDGRYPFASINFITAHDGFTLRDLVSYNEKHNEANLEDNRDGSDDNRSWNCGVEGPTDDPAVIALRKRQMANLMSTLILSQGVPMVLGGDELGRTQQGN